MNGLLWGHTAFLKYIASVDEPRALFTDFLKWGPLRLQVRITWHVSGGTREVLVKRVDYINAHSLIWITSFGNKYLRICILGWNNSFFFLAALSLHCFTWAFSSCGKQWLLSGCSAQASLCFSCCGAWTLGAWASLVVVHGFSCSMARGIFLDQGSNLCPLHWQVDS